MTTLSPQQATVLACVRALEAEGVRVTPKIVAQRTQRSLSNTQGKMSALRDKGFLKLVRLFTRADWSSVPDVEPTSKPVRAAPVSKPTKLPNFKPATIAPRPTGAVPDARFYLMRRRDTVWTSADGKHCINGRLHLTDDELIAYADAARDRDTRAARMARRAA